jgi:hypothetical protein
LVYQDSHGIHSIDGIVNRWAPSADNNDTVAYKREVCALSGFTVDQVLDLHNGPIMLKIVKAMAAMEGGSDIVWPQDEVLAGMRMAGLVV